MESGQTTANQKAYRKPESKTCVTKSTNTGGTVEGQQKATSMASFKFTVATTSSTELRVYNTSTWGPRHLQSSYPSK